MVYLPRQMRLPLDDLLAVIHEFVKPSMSRSALVRLLRRRDVSTLPEPGAVPQRLTKPLKAYEPGYVHADVQCLPQMQNETERCLCLRGHRPRHALGLHRCQALCSHHSFN